MGKVAIVAGGSGLIGSQLIRQLSADEYSKVICLNRRSLALPEAHLSQRIVDFDNLQIDDQACDHVFCTLGTTIGAAGSREKFFQVDHDYVLNVAKLGMRMGAKKVLVVTAMGANSRSRVYYNRVKGQVEEDLQEVCGDALHLFRPSLLLGDRQETRLGESLAIKLSPLMNLFLQGPLKVYRPITAADVAKAMARVARKDIVEKSPYDSATIQRCADFYANP